MRDDTVNCTTHTNLSNFVSVPTFILQCEKIITFLFIANIHYFGPFILGDFFFFILAICLVTEYLIVISFEV